MSSIDTGHISFGYTFASDHRGVYLDISMEELFESKHGVQQGLQLDKLEAINIKKDTLQKMCSDHKNTDGTINRNIQGRLLPDEIIMLEGELRKLDLERVRYTKSVDRLYAKTKETTYS